MADGATADSGISSVKTDTYQPPAIFLHNNNNNNGVIFVMFTFNCLFVCLL